ncbi:hypothetical protein V8E52_010323 [Russula decolorans]
MVSCPSWRVAPGSLALCMCPTVQGLALLAAVHALQIFNMACALVFSHCQSYPGIHAHLII